MAKKLAARLGKDPKNHTAKSFRRLAAAQLAEVGASVVGLQMTGNWEGVATPLEHMEDSNKPCNDRMNMLDGEDMESPLKKQKCINDANAVSSTSEGKGGGVVQNNCAFINVISATGVAIGDALRNAGVVKEDQQVFKDDYY